MKEEKDFESVCAKLDKEYGKGSIIHGGELESYTGVISTGSIGLDAATGIGGIPQGKIIDIQGWESSGKSTLTQKITANAQKKFKEDGTNRKCIIVDGENSLDEKYAKALGIDLDSLIIIQLDEHGGEAAYNKAERLIETGEVGLVIYDSQNALQPKSVLEGEVGESAMGKHAKMLGQAVVKANKLAKQYDCTIIFVQQYREKIGVMFGSPLTTQGGNALKFYAHLRLTVSKTVLSEDKEAYANETKVKVAKNKVGVPFKTAKFDILYGKGIDEYGEVVDLADDLGIIQKSGSWFSYGETKLGQGKDKVVTLLEDNPEVYNEIKEKVKAKLDEQRI